MTREEIIKRREQGARLQKARVSAGYRSARAAAIANQWPESTYRAHEAGKRTIGQDDAERYAKRLRFRGASVTAAQILFGEGHANSDSLSSEPDAQDIYSLDSPGIPEPVEKLLVLFGEYVLKQVRDGKLQLDNVPKDSGMEFLAERQLEFFVSHLGAQAVVGLMERYRTRNQAQGRIAPK